MTSGGGIFQTITLGKEAIKYHEIISLDIKLYRNDCSAEKNIVHQCQTDCCYCCTCLRLSPF